MLADLVGTGAASLYSIAGCVALFVGLGFAERHLLDREIDRAVVGISSLRDRCARVARAFDLTRREEEVLVLMLEGQSTAQIADGLVVSANTVKTHVRNLYRKLGVNRRQDLAAKVLAEEDSSALCSST